jgi:hypothetical protein
MRYSVLYVLYRIRTYLSAYLRRWGNILAPDRTQGFHGRRKLILNTEPEIWVLYAPKSPWVREELLRMKAQMPEASCRLLAATFDRRFRVARQMS